MAGGGYILVQVVGGVRLCSLGLEERRKTVVRGRVTGLQARVVVCIVKRRAFAGPLVVQGREVVIEVIGVVRQGAVPVGQVGAAGQGIVIRLGSVRIIING